MMKNRGARLGFYLAMVLPAFLVYIFIIAYPVIYSFILSLSEQSAGVYNIETGKVETETVLVGLKHYLFMFRDSNFWAAFANNMIVVVVSLFGQIPIGFILAYLLYRNYVRARGFFQSMVFLPNFISTVVVGIVWNRLIYSPYGPLVTFMKKITNNPDYIFTMGSQPYAAMIPIGVALIWMYTGLYMVIFLANLQKVNSEVLEAASIDGASESQVFLRLAVPMLSGTILINAILAIAGSLKGFDLIFAMTGGGPGGITKVLPIYMYEIFRFAPETLKYTRGAAAACIIIIISFALILLTRVISKRLEKV